MADLLTELRRDIDRRLDELRPLLDEARRLQQARDALARANASSPRRGASRTRSAPTRARLIKAEGEKLDGSRRRRRAAKASSAPTRTRMTKAQSLEMDRRVLALLAEDSTQKPAALAMLTETTVGSMNSRLNRLVREGMLKKRKRGNAIQYDVRAAAETAA